MTPEEVDESAVEETIIEHLSEGRSNPEHIAFESGYPLSTIEKTLLDLAHDPTTSVEKLSGKLYRFDPDSN